MTSILIVEDDIDLSETYADLLKARGYSIQVTATVSGALKSIQQAKPKIIILDLDLPDSSGLAVIKYVHANGFDIIRLIIISGHSEMAYHADFAEMGDLVLAKPISNDQLLTLVERLTKQSNSVDPAVSARRT